MDKWITDFLARLVPQPIWDIINTAGALWDVWPWLAAAFLVGMVVGALLGRWVVAAIVGLVIAALLFFRGGAKAVVEDRAQVTERRGKRRVERKKKEATENLSWFERMRLGM